MSDLPAGVPNHVERLSDGRFAWEVAPGWRQGRGAFGGLVLSALARAMRHEVEAEGQALRALNGLIPAPVLVGPTELRVERLRAGRNTTALEAKLVQEGEVRAQATAVFAAVRRPEDTWCEVPAPPRPAWASIAPAPERTAPIPEFVQHLEQRIVSGPVFGGGDARETSGWLRLRRPDPVADELDLIVLIDAWWPAAFAAIAEPRPGATLTFAMELVGDGASLDPTVPVFHRASSPVAREGYAIDLRELWSEDGRLLALNQQTIALIR